MPFAAPFRRTVFTRSATRITKRKVQDARPLRRPLFEALESRSLLALVSYWSADNTAVDSVSGNNGMLYNGATYAAGQVGQAFRFDGVDDRINVADSPSLALTGSMTIESWVRIDAISSTASGQIFFRGDDRGGLDPYALYVNTDGTIRFLVTPDTNLGVSIGTPAPVGQFVHVAATLDDATGAMRLYLNGVQMAQAVTSVRPFGTLDAGSNPGIGIGNHGGYPTTPHNFPFHGLIDELKVYDNALTAEEVLADFNAQKGSLQPAFFISDASAAEGGVAPQYAGNLVNQGEGGLTSPYNAIYGPDGNVYVSTGAGSSVLRYDAVSGAPLPAAGKTGAEFVSPGAGGLDFARSLAFGPDGNLYVVSQNSSAVLRYDGVTGEPLGALVASGSAGLSQPRGLLFHDDGYLYVTSVGTGAIGPGLDSVLRYDAATGAPAGISGQAEDAVFIPSATGGMDNPSQIVFHSGHFYVASTSPSTSNSVLQFAPDGSFQGAFVPTGSGGLAGPAYISFQGNYLYVTSWTNNKILRYDGVSGAFVDEAVSGGGLVNPLGMLFEPSGDFLVASGGTGELRRYSESAATVFTVRLNAPFPSMVSVDFATANGSAVAGTDYVAAAGSMTFAPGQTSKAVAIQTLDDGISEPNESFAVVLSNAVGAIIADGQGVGTILDDDRTKFYVVNDGAPDRTYEYGLGGKSIENYSINSGNTLPRGAAATAAGDRVWVVDANKKVYVYNAAGLLLGSWTAGSLNTKAQIEGIATNGTDIWLVDNWSDKVYRYTSAATRLNGSQNASSSFSLRDNGRWINQDYNNTNPKDIVTDGTYLWVVNDGVTYDQVFRYTLSGTASSYYGWTISGGGGSPTGLTIDPANVSDIWIVDNITDRVYQFDGAAGRTSDSQSASTSFALASGNTNPQGIADPPAAAGSAAASGAMGDARGDSFDAALLAITAELDGWLSGGDRKRK